jgi:hypothetical protein
MGLLRPATKILPSRSSPGYEEQIWLGDAIWTLKLRKECFKRFGKKDDSWVQRYASASAMAAFMKQDGYPNTRGNEVYSEHTMADYFEYLLATDKEFERRAIIWFLDQMDKDVSPRNYEFGTGCWKQMFKTPLVTKQPWVKNKVITKGQLACLLAEETTNPGPWKLLQDGYKFHIEPKGDLTPWQVHDKMLKKGQLGGLTTGMVDGEAGSQPQMNTLPTNRVKTNLSPFLGVKPKRKPPSGEWHGVGARKVSPHRKCFSVDSSFGDCLDNRLLARLSEPVDPLPESWILKGLQLKKELTAPKPKKKKVLSGIERLKACRNKIGTCQMKVGGEYDCWKTVFQAAPSDDEPMGLVNFAAALVEAIEWRLGPDCHKVPVFESTGMCYICLSDPCECSDAEAQPMVLTTPFQDALKDYKLDFTVSHGNLHLRGYRWKSASKTNTVGYCTLKEFLEFVWAMLDEGLAKSVTYPTFTEILSTPRNVREVLVGLTTAVVLGTIGDVEPTLDVVASNYHASLVSEVVTPPEMEGCFSFEEDSFGWCSSDFVEVCPELSAIMLKAYGNAKGRLKLKSSLFEICKVLLKDTDRVVEEDDWFIMPDRELGTHKRLFPEDFVLVTHPDHIAKLGPVPYEVVPMPVDSRSFIDLGQRIISRGVMGLSDAKSMFDILAACLSTCNPIIEQSDLVYLVSGTTFHYFIGSLYQDKQIFEVCPVPREDNGTCPEFYLGHYISKFFSGIFSDVEALNRWTFEFGRLYNKYLATPRYLNDLAWSGNFVYQEPPKFHSIMPWAMEKWKIKSPNVGFKPYDDFVRKKRYVERETIKVYFSLGSCEDIDDHTGKVIAWLSELPTEISCDWRWVDKFPKGRVQTAPFFSHTTGLHEYDLVVHHGGSGTTNTCLAVGVPQMILPQIGDQYIWESTLRNHCVPPLVSERRLRALLYQERLPFKQSLEPCDLLTPAMKQRLQDDGVIFIEPVEWINHCCHDFNAYGYKETDLIVGMDDFFYYTLFNRLWEKGQTELQLKWISRSCGHQIVPPIHGGRGVAPQSTYPNHPHGLLLLPGGRIEGWDCRNNLSLDVGLWNTMSHLGDTSRDKSNGWLAFYPLNGVCDWCQVRRDLSFGICHECVGRALVKNSQENIKFLTEHRIQKHVPRKSEMVRKPKSFSVLFDPWVDSYEVRSERRYFVCDTRMLKYAPNYQVGRQLLDRIKDFSDVEHLEAYWLYTKSKPPHYKFKTDPQRIIEDAIQTHGKVIVDTIVKDVFIAISQVLSINSFGAIASRFLTRSLLSSSGRSLAMCRGKVLFDAMRHFNDFAKTLGADMIPGFINDLAKPLPEANHVSLLPYGHLAYKQIYNAYDSHRWYDVTGCCGKKGIWIHCFALRLPALGKDFGVFHTVVQVDGNYYELQQVVNNKCYINHSRYPPEATSSRPWAKSIRIDSPRIGSFDIRAVSRDLTGTDYKVLGENCIIFSNLIVYLLTGTVVPWRHFGAFGAEISTDMWKLVGKYATSFFFLSDNENRVRIDEVFKPKFSAWSQITNVSLPEGWTGPGVTTKDYGLQSLRKVELALASWDPEGGVDCPWEQDAVLSLAVHMYKRFGLTASSISAALMTIRMRHIKIRPRQVKLLERLVTIGRQLPYSRLGCDIRKVCDESVIVKKLFREGKKVVWTPLLNIAVPRHWFQQKRTLVEPDHQPENLTVQTKKRVVLDLPEIAKRYQYYFPDVEFPDLDLRWIGPGEYEVGVKVPLRTNLPKMDEFTWNLVEDLQKIHPFELGIFSLRFGTLEMAEKITDRYFTGTFDPGQLIPEEEQDEIAEAIFNAEKHLYGDAQLINPEEIWKKWKRNYSAGFPFRFNGKGRASREELVRAAGGKAKFLEGVRRYIESPEAFPTVSHSFIKDEVLPTSYIEREKIRTIIAQDPLNYFLAQACQYDQSKRLDPNSFSAVGVSAAHGEMAALAAKHLNYQHHFAMDVTALDSTAAIDAVNTIKKIRKKGFVNHPQREAVETMIDCSYDNLVASWIVDIHTGRARLKKQGLTTGHASTTPSNTDYMKVMMLYAWRKITDRPYSEFYDCVKFSSFSDDNFWSTNLPPEVFSGEKISRFWLERGVQVRVEQTSDKLSDISFLSKQFSLDKRHLDEVRDTVGVETKVAVVHDLSRLLTKFSDYKKKNTLKYRWEKLAALQLNCAHHKDVYDKVGEYLDALEPELHKRKHLRTFLKQHPRKSYQEVMEMMYKPNKKTKENFILSTFHKPTLLDFMNDWWDTFRVDVLTFDSTASTYGRLLEKFSGLLEFAGLTPEDAGTFLREPGVHVHDKEFTLEHHIYLTSGCPSTFEQFRALCQKSPFSFMMDIETFWATRERYDISEETANGLRVKVGLLLGLYTFVAWLERLLMTVPVAGPLYRMFISAKHLSEAAYSRLNSVYWLLWGDSSTVLSGLMPKDRYRSMKVLAHNIWTWFTSTDLFDFSGNIDDWQPLFDAIVQVSADVHVMVFNQDFSVLLPTPGSGEKNNMGLERKWNALCHKTSVLECKEKLSEGKTPLVTGPTGCGKSTDFIVNCHDHGWDTVIVSCPRRILVQQNPVAQKRLYAGCDDSLTPGLINFGTAGYLRRVLTELPANAILILDEFHEMDEDSLWLFERFRRQCVVVSATPDFYGANLLDPVILRASRTTGHRVEVDIRKGKGSIQEAWEELVNGSEKYNGKTLVICPSIKMVKELEHHATQLAPSKTSCCLYRGHTLVPDVDWYFGTSVVDAGLTIPNLVRVIDTGWSSGWYNGTFTIRPSSHNTMEQRKGRTGRTNDGLYVRLQSTYNDLPWDFSIGFLCNSWSVAKVWRPDLKRPKNPATGFLDSLPPGYEEFFKNKDYSVLLYLTYLYVSRLDVNKARSLYQTARKFPRTPEIEYITGKSENKNFLDLCVVEHRLKTYRLPGEEGNLWNWDGQSTRLEDFEEVIPKHLRDVD